MNRPLEPIRRTLFDLVEPTAKRTVASYFYDIIMLLAIIGSIIPLMSRSNYPIFTVIDYIAVSLFVVDYCLRWATADMLMPKRKRLVAFLIYPFTPFAIIDLISILPVFDAVDKTFAILRVSRIFRVLRIMRYLRYSKQINIIVNVFRRERDILISVFGITVSYIFVVALIMFNVENLEGVSERFDTFLDALYWATITLATIGYGDIVPVTDLGKIIAMISSILGIAIIALPSGIIMAGYMNEVRSRRKSSHNQKDNENGDHN